MILSSPCIRDYLLGYKLNGSTFSRLFIRPYLDDMTLKRGKVYLHAKKSKLLTEYKSVFNHVTYDYELLPSIKIDDDIFIDWKCKPYITPRDLFISWSSHYKSYLLSLK